MSGKIFGFRSVAGVLGLAAACAVFGALGGADAAFAKQFACEGRQAGPPPTVCSPELRMMVDPATRQPIYDKNWKVSRRCVIISSNKPPQCVHQ